MASAAAGLLLGGCTYGQVTWGGDPVVGAEVSISNCDAESWYDVTDSQGYYAMNGYDDADDAIPEGLILILVTIGDIQRFEFRAVSYGPCPDDPDRLCDREDVDLGFKPQTPWEWQIWHDANDTHNTNEIHDFFAFCG
jgi:hypothetical protein